MLYVLFWIVVVTLVVPSLHPWTTACGVLLATCLLEITQLWKPPVLERVRQTFIGHALIGSTFEGWDLLHYGVGAVLGGLFIQKMKQSVEMPSPDTIIHGTWAETETGEGRNTPEEGADTHPSQN